MSKCVDMGGHTVSDNLDRDADTLDDFCERHGFSRSMFYKLRAQGLAPAEFNVGKRVMISKEAGRAWRRQREAAARKAREAENA
jgi:predicted DNA-binding transcriptional regulator AlpA